MESPAYVLKPDIMNALFPSFMKSMIISLVITVSLYLLSLLLNVLGIISFSLELKLATIIIPFIIFIVIPLGWELFLLMNTKYYFYHTHVIREFKFIIVRRFSVVYAKITNINLDISVWDRITNAGDVVIHTAEDNAADMVLKYIKKPADVEQQIYKFIKRSLPTTQMQSLQDQPFHQSAQNSQYHSHPQRQHHRAHPNHYQGHHPNHQNKNN